jgi:hypothetical protein
MFLYCHPDMDKNEDIRTRIKFCLDRKILPYVMRDESCYYHSDSNFYTDIASWCNQPNICKKMSFKEFIIRRTSNKQ